jgi:hypothetical protein
MRKTALLLGIIAVIFPPSLRSDAPKPDLKHIVEVDLYGEPPKPDSEYVFEVGLFDDRPIYLSPSVFFAFKSRSSFVSSCFDCVPDVKPVSIILSLSQNDWTMTLELR